jgi:flagellar basal-body rod protein FlgB
MHHMPPPFVGIAARRFICLPMSTPSMDVFALAEKRLAWIDRRQDVLAQNIANANTPGYAARDIRSFGDVLAAQTRTEQARQQQTASSGTSQSIFDAVGSMATALPQTSDPDAASDRASPGRSPDGNAVVLDDQLMKVAETDNAHQLAMNLYRKYAGLFKTALGRS